MEIIISMILITLTITGLLHLFVAGKRLLFLSHARMTGGELGKSFLDPLHMQVRQDQWGNNCLSTGTGCPRYQIIGSINYAATYNISNVLETNNSLSRVKVDISWNESLP